MSEPQEENRRHCRDCGRPMWALDLPGFGRLWQCPSCHHSVDTLGTKHAWADPNETKQEVSRPKREPIRTRTQERKFKTAQPCPRCGQGLWTIEVQDYGSRQQCEDCRISIVEGAVMEWRKPTRT